MVDMCHKVVEVAVDSHIHENCPNCQNWDMVGWESSLNNYVG